jgi:CBS domain-containing protein
MQEVRKIMTKNPSCCTTDSTLQEVAHMMEMYDCGCIPVVEDHQTKRPLGTITDRDIVIRTFSANKNPLEMKASDIMTTDIATVTPETDVAQCLKVMEEKQIRRVLVVDKDRRCVGIVAQADLAEHGTNAADTARFLREVSETESDRTREKQFQPQNSSDSDRVRYTQNYRSFSQNESPARPRETYKKSYREKESSSTGKILLALLGTIGLGAGLKYYFGTEEENKRRSFPNRKINADQPEAKIMVEKKTTQLPLNPPPAIRTETPLSTSSIDLTGNKDTVGGSVGSFNKTNDDDDLKPITEIGRTASKT